MARKLGESGYRTPTGRVYFLVASLLAVVGLVVSNISSSVLIVFAISVAFSACLAIGYGITQHSGKNRALIAGAAGCLSIAFATFLLVPANLGSAPLGKILLSSLPIVLAALMLKLVKGDDRAEN